MNEFLETKAALSVNDAGEITGTAWVFSRPDRVGDVIEPNAFMNAKTPLPFLFSHDQSQVIGVWHGVETRGDTLSVKGKLLIESVDKAREVYALIKAGALRGLSIGFQTLKSSPRKGGGRTISNLDLVEISAVAVPAHAGARIETIKSAIKGEAMETEIENEDIETKSAEVAELETKFSSLETRLDELGLIGKRLDKLETRLSRPGIIGRATDAKDDGADIERKAFVEYARSGRLDTKALSVAGSGGALVPQVLLNEIQKNLVLFSPIRSVARVTAVSVPTVTLPKRTANLTAAWVGETAARSESTPTYSQQAFTAYEVACYSDISLQLLEDSQFDLQSELMRDIGEEFGRIESAAFVSGDGAGKPTGILNAPPVGQTVNAAGATLAPDDLIKLFYALPTPFARRGAWLMNRATIGLIRGFKSTTGEYLWAPGTGENGLVPGTAGTLLGAPVVECPDFPDVAPSTISVAFGDWQSAYRIVDRVGVEIVRDDYSVRNTGQVRFHARRRVGGAVAQAEAVRYLKTSA